MDRFSISQLSRYSGVKAHTIRIWEKRYGALKPSRTEGNTRFYGNDQLKRLLNITGLIRAGCKVSEIGSLPDKQLFQLAGTALLPYRNENEKSDPDIYITQLVKAGTGYDETYFDEILYHCILAMGIKTTYTQVIYPMLCRLGLMWSADLIPPAQEHFISNLLRQKLSAAINSLPPFKGNAGKWILFLPENEFHEIGLLLSHYLLRYAGERSIYLGSNTPIESLKSCVDVINPQNILLFIPHQFSAKEIEIYLNSLRTFFKSTIYIAGNVEKIRSLKLSKKIVPLYAPDCLEKELKKSN